MPLNKQRGNMYTFVTHTHSHLRGKCPHGCSYCYVQAHERRWKTGAFSGPLRIDEKELRVRYGEGKTIFIEHQNDLFAEDVLEGEVELVLDHAAAWPKNTYVFQTKNPDGMLCWLSSLPEKSILGVTIESNRHYPEIMGYAPPPPYRRAEAMTHIRFDCPTATIFVTVEPILDFDVDELVAMLRSVRPTFVNIGADSKGHGLPEPPWSKVEALLAGLEAARIEVRQKSNLDRLRRAGK